MRCPRCEEWLTQSTSQCGKCGLEVVEFIRLQTLRSDLSQTIRDFERITRRLQGLQDSAAHSEATLIVKLLALSGAEASVRPTPEDAEATQELHPSSPAEPPPMPPPSRLDGLPLEAGRRRPWVATGPSREFAANRTYDETKLGQKWLLIVGIVVVVLGVGYFLKYAFDRNWIGPTGRVVMAYAGGFVCLGFGELFRRRGLVQFGLYLIGGGIAVLYFSGYAAFQIYQLLDQIVAFALMVVVTALAGVLSIRRDVAWLAVLGIIGGFLTPVVLSTRTDNQIPLMGYMTVLNAGILAIATYKRWGLLNGLGFAATWLLFLSWFAAHYQIAKFLPTTIFLNVFFVAYAIVPFAYYFVRCDAAPRPGFAITLLNAMIAFSLSFAMIREFSATRDVTIVSMSYAFLYGLMAFYLRRRNPHRTDAFVLLAAMSALFLIVTVPIYFSRHWITVFWAIQAATLVWAATRIGDERLLRAGAGLLLVALFKLFFVDMVFLFELVLPELYYRFGYGPDAPIRWITFAAVLAATFAAATMLRGNSKKAQGLSSAVAVSRLQYSIFGSILLVVLTIEASAWFFEHARTARFAAISVLWALFAIGLMLLGFALRFAVLRKCSLVLFAITLARVFVWDMSNVSTPYRIVSFLVLGMMLIGASYLYHRFKGRLAVPSASEEG